MNKRTPIALAAALLLSGVTAAAAAGMTQASPPLHNGHQQDMSCCHESVNSMPNCPAHNRRTPSHCGASEVCCGLCSERARPSAILSSYGHTHAKQLSADGAAAAKVVPAVTSSLLASGRGSGLPPLIPVDHKKTDLRI